MTDRAHVLVRADAGLGMGFGHLMRCLALTRALTSAGARVTVAARIGDDSLERRVHEAGGQLHKLGDIDQSEIANGPHWPTNRQTMEAEGLAEEYADKVQAVVVDHYRLASPWEGVWRRHGVRVVAIDDLADRDHAADVVVDHNWYGPATAHRYEGRVAPGAMLLLGPRYALLQPEYARLRQARSLNVRDFGAVLVSFGGTDVLGQSALAVQALAGFPEVRVDVVVGTDAAVSDALVVSVGSHPQAQLHVGVPSLAPLLAGCDLAIGAGGTSTWERLCMGVPALVTTVSENQSGVTRQFHADGVVRWLGTADAVATEHYVAELQRIRHKGWPELPDIVDGQGAARVALAVLGAPNGEFRGRPPADGDAAAYVTAGGAGVHDGRGTDAWRERTQWFRSPQRSQEALQIVEYAGVAVGVHTQGGHIELDPYVAEL